MSIDWKYNDADIGVFPIPILRYDEEYEMSVYVTPVSTLQNAFLYTDSDHLNIIEAKRFSQIVYMSVGSYSSSPNCFLGSIDAGTETGINVKLDFSEASLWGEQNIPMWIGGGENIEPISPLYNDIFWKDDIDDPPSFWALSSEYSSLWTWIESI